MGRFLLANFLYFFFFHSASFAQPSGLKTPSEIQLAIEKLNVLGSVLYIAAHPDDENTSAIAYLSKGKKFRTCYLSLTRGDGGQNLIGAEKGFEIGILRTQELVQARKIDGAEQFFTRAIDFGYSKSPEETLEIWNKDEILGDIVWIIRNFKPDIIITRFPIGGSGGHGHHTASALLTVEAFDAAADPNKFPEQIKFVTPWQTKKLFWNNWRPTNTDGLIACDVGEFNPLLAKAYTEIGAQSRSMHKSQGFGATPYRAQRLEYFQLIKGSASKNLMSEINTSWGRIENGQIVQQKIEDIIKNFSHGTPANSIPALLELYNFLSTMPKDDWIDLKKKELGEIIKSCAGIWIETTADDFSSTPGQSVKITTTVNNRSDQLVVLDALELPSLGLKKILSKELKNNLPEIVDENITIPENYPITQPYWLDEKPLKGIYKISVQKNIGAAENEPAIPIRVILDFNGTKIPFEIPLYYKWNDRVEGEQYRPFEVRPKIVSIINSKVAVFPHDKPKEIQFKIKSFTSNATGFIHFEKNDGWEIEPSRIPFDLKNKYDEKTISVLAYPPKDQHTTNLKIIVNVSGTDIAKSMIEINHDHIERRIYFPDSEIKLVRLDLKVPGGKIGYIMGSGDNIPEYLEQLGYDVILLSDEMLENNNLSQYKTIISGIRAYNTRDRLRYVQPKIMDYIKNGGTFVMQYNVASGLQANELGPFPFKIGNNRITDENSKIKFIDPTHKLLHYPNNISDDDFNNWIQERGLYFANEWDENYKTVFSGHDKYEKDLPGNTIITEYGKGVFIYTGLSWFRQLPAGITGAYRIFVNLISAGENGN